MIMIWDFIANMGWKDYVVLVATCALAAWAMWPSRHPIVMWQPPNPTPRDLYREMTVRCPECWQAPAWGLLAPNIVGCVHCEKKFKVTVVGGLRLAERIK